MDDDPVLRRLAAELEHDDPRLAALLRTGPTPLARRVLAAPAPAPAATGAAPERHRRRPPRWVFVLAGVLACALLLLASIRLGLAVLGALAITAMLLSPLAAVWWVATADELRPPDNR